MKKKLIAAALLVIGLAILSAGTIAYFTSSTTAHNVITSGGVNITLEEWADEVGKTPYPTDSVPAMPGQTVTKIVTVKNTDADAFVRAKFSIKVYSGDKDVTGELDNLDQAIVIKCDGDWEPGEGGWYYYNALLENGARTAPLFSQVEFDGPNMTNAYQNCTIKVDVVAQAVQAANNGPSALSAAGWPEE